MDRWKVAGFAALVVTGFGCGRETAPPNAIDPVAETQALVDLLTTELRQRMAQFDRDNKSKIDAEFYVPLARGEGSGPEKPLESDEIAKRRARVLARIDLLRNAFPQFFCELIAQPIITEGITEGVIVRSLGPEGPPDPAADIFRGPALGTGAPISHHPHVAALRSHFLDRLPASLSGDEIKPRAIDWFYPAGHDAQTESVECLYMILNHASYGAPLGDRVPSKHIADTDGDGFPEYVDGFGRPLRFYRWPTDFYAYQIDILKRRRSSYPNGLGTDDRYDESVYVERLRDAGMDDTRLLYAKNWFDAHRWRQWKLPQAIFRQENATAFQVLTFRTHQLYDIRRSALQTKLYLSPPVHFPAVDFGFGLSGQQINTNDDLSDFPRWYPRDPLVISAGPDRRFGLYTPDPANRHGDRPRNLSPPLKMWAALQLDYRCGRVDARYRDQVADNLVGQVTDSDERFRQPIHTRPRNDGPLDRR